MNRLALLLLFFLFQFCLKAQICNYEIFNETQNQNRFAPEVSDNSISRNNFTIPLVIHIVWRTEAQRINLKQVRTQVDQLNRDFLLENIERQIIKENFRNVAADTGIQFCLAGVTPTGEPTSGITYTQTEKAGIGLSNDIFFTDSGGKDAWDTKRYLNVWVCEQIDGLLGYASSPSSENELKDGVVINFLNFGSSGSAYNSEPFNLGKTLVHEIGHYLGLLHPWGNTTGECFEDDGIEDTPAQSRIYGGCGLQRSSCGSEDMLQNFMQVTEDDCLMFFTQGQVNRMHEVLMNSRVELVQNNVECASEEYPLEEKLEIFPNPTQGLTHITYLNNNLVKGETSIFRLFDFQGKLIRILELRSNEIFLIDFSFLAQGMYIIENGNFAEKILVL